MWSLLCDKIFSEKITLYNNCEKFELIIENLMKYVEFLIYIPEVG